MVLFMTPGLALFYGGMDRSRNVLNMFMMNFWCLLVVPLVWVIAGFSLAYSGSGTFIGNLDWTLLSGLGIDAADAGGDGGKLATKLIDSAALPVIWRNHVMDGVAHAATPCESYLPVLRQRPNSPWM